ncbi:putative fad fmn-containing isoamyl alcohol oxidase protein [Lasiodiplodia theobromae]|nr:putative fad fmn-containing isoamyl alcohol oxidase protein [Lasiodiplodia theobromae]
MGAFDFMYEKFAPLTFAVALGWGANAQNESCRSFPGDDLWPSVADWAQLNDTVGGRLIATVPLGAPCHDPTYDSTVCSTLQASWTSPELHDESSSSVMAPFFANQSCDPFTATDTPCTLGNYVQYAINVSSADDAIAGIRFATDKNVRLVIRNTGHDYLGKSTGAGSLGLWMHHLKDIEIIDYSDAHYTGKAIKIGAGVQAGQAADAADAQGLVTIGGNSPTVGIAGGYSQGGGHTPLASKYGMAADQVLEWEVVDGLGNVHIANRQNNTDLYWAMSGGGGSTYGVALAMTAKLYEDIPVSGANISFASANITADSFWNAIEKWSEVISPLLDKGIVANSYAMNTSFAIAPITAPGITADELSSLLQPYLSHLDSLGIQYQHSVVQFPGYLAQHDAMTPVQGVGTTQGGSWIIPRAVVRERNDELTAAFRSVANDGGIVVNLHLRPSKEVAGDVDNAVLPAWRDADMASVIATLWNFTAPWSEMVADQEKITNKYVPMFSSLAPESGTYMNEADYNQPDWQTAFYGANYDRLRSVKAKYDPHDIFYATTAVGSDEWVVHEGGRLCKK